MPYEGVISGRLEDMPERIITECCGLDAILWKISVFEKARLRIDPARADAITPLPHTAEERATFECEREESSNGMCGYRAKVIAF